MGDLFLRACRGEPVERTPIWLMRQAGRSLPEYRRVRERTDFVTLCRTPELAAEVTLQPVRRLKVDAAILFSDILVPAACLGLSVDFEPGPIVASPPRTAAAIASLPVAEPGEKTPYVFETIRIVRRELDGRVPLIGFAGAPLTLAAYLVEGRGSKSFGTFKALVLGAPEAAHALLEKVTAVTERYLLGQLEAGAEAVQLFDTWAGLFDRETFREFGLPYARRVLERLRGCSVPRIYFALDAAHLLEEIGTVGADVVGVDWRLALGQAAARLGRPAVLQGNLDPAVLLAPPAEIVRRAALVVREGRTLPGHVFNLGHGVLPETPVEHLEALVAAVQGL